MLYIHAKYLQNFFHNITCAIHMSTDLKILSHFKKANILMNWRRENFLIYDFFLIPSHIFEKHVWDYFQK